MTNQAAEFYILKFRVTEMNFCIMFVLFVLIRQIISCCEVQAVSALVLVKF